MKPLTPMTPEQRGEAAMFLPPYQSPAAPELIASVIRRARAAGISATTAADIAALLIDVAAVVRRLLDAEQQLATCRRILATAVVTADDEPDYGLSAGDLLQLLTGSGLDLAADMAEAETLREAEALAGAR